MSAKDKTYRITKELSGISYLINSGRSGNLTLYDGKQRRAIRHCPNQKSIFLDEQDKYGIVEPIEFNYGYLTVPYHQPITQDFLDNHPSNSANTPNGKGGLFELVDEEKEAKEAIELEELEIDLKYEVRKVAKKKDGLHELRAVVSVLLGSVDDTMNKGVEELKSILYNEIEADPHRFTDSNGNINIFDNDDALRKYVILNAIKEGIIKKDPTGRAILWAKSGKEIITAPRSVNLIDHFSEFLATDEGMLVYAEMENRR